MSKMLLSSSVCLVLVYLLQEADVVVIDVARFEAFQIDL